MKRLTLLMAAVLLASVWCAEAVARKKKPKAQALPATIEIIKKVNDHWQLTHAPETRAFWDEAAYHTGNMEAYKLLGEARWLAYSDAWARHNRWMGATESDPRKWKYKDYGEGHDYVLFGDWQICFQTYLDIYQLAPDAHKIRRAVEVMDYEVRLPHTDFWWWADALYMVMPVFTKLYKVTGETKYLDKLYANFMYADSLMFDTEAHLYYRDGRYIFPKHKTDLGKRDFWARGNGWVLAGLSKVLSDMPADYIHRRVFEQRFLQLAEAVRASQQPDGYWSRSMLDPLQAEGPETSGTAFFAYGLFWGMNHGILPRQEYAEAAEKAWRYLVQTALQPNGSIGYVQPIGDRAIKGQQLTAANVANFGVGAFLLAACERLRYEDAQASDPVVTIEVSNASDEFRQQVVEVGVAEVFSKLGIQGGRQFVVLDAAGLEVPYQLSHDGKVLLDAGVSPKGMQRFVIRRGMPSIAPMVCYGRIVPERKDDFAWENDRGAYRLYGPALQATGEQSYGIDVWSKNSPDLVVDHRYWVEDAIGPEVKRLRQSDKQRADSLYRAHSYHNDHGRGMDLYQVGTTLGCGAPAIVSQGKMVFPRCFKSWKLLDMGPLRLTAEFCYATTDIDGDSVTEHRIVQLDKGSNFNKMTVWYEGLTHSVQIASGVALHSADDGMIQLGPDYVAYADPTDNVEHHNSLLFVATLYPEGVSATIKQLDDTPTHGNYGHLLGLLDNYINASPWTYFFGSAWSKYDVRSLSEWRERIGWTLRSFRQPLEVVIK